eukprot:scaffold294_cov221-Amphora_coffeaeformis.AAC.68
MQYNGTGTMVPYHTSCEMDPCQFDTQLGSRAHFRFSFRIKTQYPSFVSTRQFVYYLDTIPKVLKASSDRSIKEAKQ